MIYFPTFSTMELPDPNRSLIESARVVPHPCFPIDKKVTIEDVVIAKRKFIALITSQVLGRLISQGYDGPFTFWPNSNDPIILYHNITDEDLIRYENDWTELSVLFESNIMSSTGHFAVEVVGRDKKFLMLIEPA